MTNIEIIVGSTLGNAECVADEIAQSLTQYNCTVHTQTNLEDLDQNAPWIFVSSTHGAGEIPDNLQPLITKLAQAKPQLSNEIYLCGIGDRSYEEFCGAINTIENILKNDCLASIVDKVMIDMQEDDLPEDRAISWINKLI